MTELAPRSTVISFFLSGNPHAVTEVPQDSLTQLLSTSRCHRTLTAGKNGYAGTHTRCFALFLALLTWTAATAGLARATGTLSFSPSFASFGNVTVGTSKSIGIAIKNTGTTSVYINQESLIASMYSVSGITIPKTLSPGASFTMYIKFAPTSAKTSSGYVTIGSNATDSLVRVIVSGTGVSGTSSTPASTSTLTASQTSVGFGTVPIGTTYSHLVQFKNSGTSSITVSGGSVTGTAFKITSNSYPVTLPPGQSLSITVSFTPTSTASVSGSMTLTSNATDRTLSVSLSGTGAGASRTLSSSTTSLNFGNVTVGKSEMLPVTLKNTGSSSLTVSSVTVSGANITTSGGVSGATIAAGQSATLDVSFSPSQVETVSGKVVVNSNASDSALSITISAAGVSATQHSVSLHWNASTSSGVKGYYVYRALSPSTTFSKIFSTPISTTAYTDTGVVAGDTYQYAVTAVSTTGLESTKSTAVKVLIQ